VASITGAGTTGIGAERAALRAARPRWRSSTCASRAGPHEADVRAAGESTALAADLAQPDDCARWWRARCGRSVRLDVVLNNCGVGTMVVAAPWRASRSALGLAQDVNCAPSIW